MTDISKEAWAAYDDGSLSGVERQAFLAGWANRTGADYWTETPEGGAS
jgi:hypothetical protein